MQIKIGEFDCTECWDGVFYKKLSNYPAISEWEIQNVLDFEHYGIINGVQRMLYLCGFQELKKRLDNKMITLDN